MENMLSIKKVQQHGISTSKWTTKDKTIQYKGLIKLYIRDQVDNKRHVAEEIEKQQKALNQLQKKVTEGRHGLDNLIKGNKQELRTTLQNHKRFQLAYQNSTPRKATESIEHINFKKRKELDRMEDLIKKKDAELIELKLELATMEDRYKEHQDQKTTKLQVEEKTQSLAGKVQDVILKQEVAFAIRQTYIKIRDVMKKDSLYFDGILEVLRKDGLAQSTCMINATSLGQLTTEKLDDTKREFFKVENHVRDQMAGRKKDVDFAETLLRNSKRVIKRLIRESQTNVCANIYETRGIRQLRKDLARQETVLDLLRSNTYAISFEGIYLSLENQRSQYRHLKEMITEAETQRDRLLNKLNHAKTMINYLKSSMSDGTMDYIKMKKILIENIKTEIERKNIYDKRKEEKEEKLANIKISFNCILKQLKPIKVTEDRSKDQTSRRSSTDETHFVTAMECMTTKLGKLYEKVQEKASDEYQYKAYKLYETSVRQRINIGGPEIPIVTDLLEDKEFSLSKILTREEIKEQSKEIVRFNLLKNEL